MAKQSEDRENLLRDGIAMPVRGRMLIDGTEVVIGFRRGGQLSFYWDQDPVFQFDVRHHVRRAYVDSAAYKADRGSLARLSRPDPSARAEAQRLRLTESTLTGDEQGPILARLENCLQQIKTSVLDVDVAVTRHQLECVGADPKDFCDRVARWIDQTPSPPLIADSPSA